MFFYAFVKRLTRMLSRKGKYPMTTAPAIMRTPMSNKKRIIKADFPPPTPRIAEMVVLIPPRPRAAVATLNMAMLGTVPDSLICLKKFIFERTKIKCDNVYFNNQHILFHHLLLSFKGQKSH